MIRAIGFWNVCGIAAVLAMLGYISWLEVTGNRIPHLEPPRYVIGEDVLTRPPGVPNQRAPDDGTGGWLGGPLSRPCCQCEAERTIHLWRQLTEDE